MFHKSSFNSTRGCLKFISIQENIKQWGIDEVLPCIENWLSELGTD
jgi:hypothetical protein